MCVCNGNDAILLNEIGAAIRDSQFAKCMHGFWSIQRQWLAGRWGFSSSCFHVWYSTPCSIIWHLIHPRIRNLHAHIQDAAAHRLSLHRPHIHTHVISFIDFIGGILFQAELSRTEVSLDEYTPPLLADIYIFCFFFYYLVFFRFTIPYTIGDRIYGNQL